jgi:hypothetical protein
MGMALASLPREAESFPERLTAPQSTFARRFCAIGAIMRAGRELRLRTQDACFALQWQTLHPGEVVASTWNRAHQSLASQRRRRAKL